jgi:threonyl-tRNA synthetase
MAIWNVLEDLRRREDRARGYVEVRTPQIYDKELWVTSGHWEKYREHMFTFESQGETAQHREFGLKPMNCPGHAALYADGAYSYRELPLRMAEAGVLHRDELTGALHGLLRVRMFSQDDAHLFCTPEQVEDEVLGCLDFGYSIYDRLGLEIKVELSTRPEDKLGTDEEWDVAEAALAAALERRGLEYTINAGDGAFYGPKIDLHMLDSLDRAWQIGTVQLDFQMPQRFNLRYQGKDNAEHTPVMIHRALIGSFERFIGILIEHFAGAFPFWLAPVQARVLPVGLDHHEASHALAAKLGAYRVEVDDSDETVGKRIRNAEVAKVPYVLVYGDKESEEALSVRERGGEQWTASLAGLLERLEAQSA